MQLIFAVLLSLLPANPPVMMTLASDGASVTLAWDANTDPIDGYRIYWGTGPRSYTTHYDVGKATTFTVPRTFGPGQYFFAATAYLRPVESGYSNEVSMAVLPAPASTSPMFISDRRELDLCDRRDNRMDNGRRLFRLRSLRHRSRAALGRGRE